MTCKSSHKINLAIDNRCIKLSRFNPLYCITGRTSSIHRQSVPLSSFPKSVHDCGAVVKYRTYSSGGSYVGIPPPNEPGHSGQDFPQVPLVADIPAPGQFSSQTLPSRNINKEDSITC